MVRSIGRRSQVEADGALLFLLARARFHESVATFPERVYVAAPLNPAPSDRSYVLRGSRDASAPSPLPRIPSNSLSFSSHPHIPDTPLRREIICSIEKINGAPRR